MEKQVSETIKQVFLAIATSDALGVPVEFTPRSVRQADPVTDMRGNGTYMPTFALPFRRRSLTTLRQS